MDHNTNIGRKLKELRLKHNYTLKQLSEKVGVSIGFLSQVERGRATLGMNTLAKVAETFDTDMSVFFTARQDSSEEVVVRSFERQFLQVSDEFIHYTMCRNLMDNHLTVQIYEIMPYDRSFSDKPVVFSHDYEEYLYVLEGVLTVWIDDKQYAMFPGDGVSILPNHEHSWRNHGTKVTKVLSVVNVVFDAVIGNE